MTMLTVMANPESIASREAPDQSKAPRRSNSERDRARQGAPSTAPHTDVKSAAWTAARREELQLLAAVASRDEAAFEKLVHEYQHRVFGFCVRLLGNRAEAEDLAQEIFLTVYKNADRFRGESSFSTWLMRIAKNQSLNRLKYLERRGRSRSRPLDEVQDSGQPWLIDEKARPDDTAESRQVAAVVQAEIEKLAPEHRVVLVLREVDDLSYEEISEITSLPLGTVKSRIHRGRSQLAARLMRIFK